MTVPNFTAGQVLTAAELDTLRSALGMTIPDFTAGQVLTAAELNQLVAVANNPEVYGTATGGTGVVAVTIGGVDYNYTSFTSTGTLTITKGGLFETLVFGGGGAGGVISVGAATYYCGGGGAGGIQESKIYLSANQTITVGAGGSGATGGIDPTSGTSSTAGTIVAGVGGGWGSFSGGGDRSIPSSGG